MYNDELFQTIAAHPGMTISEIAEFLGQSKNSVRRRLSRLEKYDVLYTRQVPSPRRGWTTVNAYYPQPSALKYLRE